MIATNMERISASATGCPCRAAEFGLFGEKLVGGFGFRVDVEVEGAPVEMLELDVPIGLGLELDVAIGLGLELDVAIGLGVVLAFNVCF